MKSNENGFTLAEFLICLVLLAIIAAIALPNIIRARDEARNREVKSNVHKIHIALERYHIDNCGQYPAMIWGGDKQGWSTKKGVGCRTMWEHEPFNGENESTAHPPIDPLLYYGYINCYPRNPFMNKGMGVHTTIKWTGPRDAQLGDGDPRFGYDGEKMGNTLTDPRYLWKQMPDGKIELTRIKNCFPEAAKEVYAEMIHERVPANPFYAMGGIPYMRSSANFSYIEAGHKEKLPEILDTHWPGEFFYRSSGTFIIPDEFQDETSSNPPFRNIWDFKCKKIDRYFLGGYGSMRTEGMDVIRLTDENHHTINNVVGFGNWNYGNADFNLYYESHPNYSQTSSIPIMFSSPEVFGGGDFEKMPYFPYTDPKTENWLYGAPDGCPDGVVIAIRSHHPPIMYEKITD